MNGRLEHSIKTNNNIQKILSELPNEIAEYYYTIAPSAEPKTCEDYLKKIKRFLIFCLPNNVTLKEIELNKITDSNVGKYLMKIQTKTDKDGNISPTSFSHQKCVWTSLNGFFNYLFNKGYINSNPMALVKRPDKEDDIKRVILSIDDINDIILNIEQGAGSKYAQSRQKDWVERDVAIFKLFLSTGMRRTALSEINISDIDFDKNMIKIIDKRHKVHEYYIQEKLRCSLLKWCRKREQILNGTKEDAFFISARKKRMSEKSIYNIVTKYAEETLGYKISPHKLRAVFCVTYYDACGGDIKSTMEAMGQRNITTTQRYINSKNNAREESSKVINNLMV